jgi:hypothetical protein
MTALGRRLRYLRRTGAAAISLLLACLTAPAPTIAAPSVSLKTALVPERLGKDTTIETDLNISSPNGRTPPPLRNLSLYYPLQLGILSSGLGVDECPTTILETLGERGCPSQSLMGYGTATAAVQVGDQQILENAIASVYMAPFQNGAITLNFFIDAKTPLVDEIVLTGSIKRAQPPYGGKLTIDLPVLESWPDGPDVALLKLRSTIGPLGITYYDHSHGNYIPYHPRGSRLPRHCPHGGFPFAASLEFLDGTNIVRRTAVPCPHV